MTFLIADERYIFFIGLALHNSTQLCFSVYLSW